MKDQKKSCSGAMARHERDKTFVKPADWDRRLSG